MFAKDFAAAPSTYVGAQFWDNKHPLTAVKDEMWKKHVPAAGSCNSLEAELFLAANRLGYDYYNNGFCNNPVGFHDFITEHGYDDKLPNSAADMRCVGKALNIIDAFLYDEEDFAAARRDYQNSFDDEGEDDEGDPEPDCCEVDFKNRSVDWALDFLVEHYLERLVAADAANKFTELKERLFD